ncbi:MAG: alpha/beta fold hydrolase [Myxococcales bacterium]|nr:alpha/beta fold hydrolase [Myxococcales bacterium]
MITFTDKTRSTPRIAYGLRGDAGSPVLLIMGFGMSGSAWVPQARTLSETHRCCMYDHLGVGASDAGPAFPTIASMAGDALRLMDELGWERAHIVGVSMGGMIAQELALRAQDRCLSLTLIATHGGAFGASMPRPRAVYLFIKSILGHGQARTEALDELLYPPGVLDSLDPALKLVGREADLDEPPSMRTFVGELSAVYRHRTEARLGRLRLPTLLVRPGGDILIDPKQTDRLAERIPNATVIRFEDAGHGVTFHKARELNAALLDHFDAADRRDSHPSTDTNHSHHA